MANYARDQPDGYINKIHKVAIVGASGQLGRHITEQILTMGKHSVTALTRIDSKAEFPSGAAVARIDYNDEASLVSALTGHDFLIIALAYNAGPHVHSKIVRAAGSAGVPHIMPNVYTGDFVVDNTELGDEIMMGKMARPLVQEIESIGVSFWTVLVTGFWYEFSLAAPPEWFGFDLTNRSVTMFDNGGRKINTTTWPQCGRAVAALLSLKVLPEDENDNSLTLSHFRNQPLYVSSFFISQRDMLDSVQRVTNTTEEGWQIKYEPTSKRVEEGQEQFARGDPKGLAKSYYSRMFYAGSEGTYERKLHNQSLGLPTEDLDEATAGAVDMAKKGWSPF